MSSTVPAGDVFVAAAVCVGADVAVDVGLTPECPPGLVKPPACVVAATGETAVVLCGADDDAAIASVG
jgi:hypothetical protein